MASVDTGAIEGEVDRIRSLGLEDLRREWRRLNHGEPPRISRDLLVLALGYRLQEIAHGGLGKATRRKLANDGEGLADTLRTVCCVREDSRVVLCAPSECPPRPLSSFAPPQAADGACPGVLSWTS